MEESTNKKQNINSLPAKMRFSKCLVTNQLKQSNKKMKLREKNGSTKSVGEIECYQQGYAIASLA